MTVKEAEIRTRSHVKRDTFNFSLAARMTSSLIRARFAMTVRFVSGGATGETGEVLCAPLRLARDGDADGVPFAPS